MIVINGSFLCRNLTGIERFAFEICKNLDNLVSKNEFGIYIPSNAKIIPEYKNIQIFISEKSVSSFPIWDHFIFSNFLKKNNYLPLDFSNVTPLFSPGIVFIHDIYAKLYPSDFCSFKDKLIRMYMCLMYKHAVKHSKLLLTVSNFSKNQISQTYKISDSKIIVIPNGWDHFSDIKSDMNIYNKFPTLLQKPFYFTLGSLQKRKNLKWILNYAKNNADDIFAISGKAISGMVSNEITELKQLKNVILLGYVSDEEVKALMSKCKAFIFPSYYEGFGIPPLEALSTGAKIIVSDIEVFREIYSDCAYYINPDNININLNELLQKDIKSPSEILNNYTYEKAAVSLYNTIKNSNIL